MGWEGMGWGGIASREFFGRCTIVTPRGGGEAEGVWEKDGRRFCVRALFGVLMGSVQRSIR